MGGWVKCDFRSHSGTWTLVKREILKYGKFHNNVEDWRILNLLLPKSRLDKELVCLISSYVLYVWDSIYTRGADVKADQFFGFLRFKYKELQSESIRLENLQMFN